MKRKRYRKLVARPGEIRVKYTKAESYDSPDVCVAWGGQGAYKCDAHLILGAFCSKQIELIYDPVDKQKNFGQPYKFGPSLVQELEERGYDITTIEFRIRKKNIDGSAGKQETVVQPAVHTEDGQGAGDSQSSSGGDSAAS